MHHHLIDALFPHAPEERPRILSVEECQRVADAIARGARHGGYSIVAISSEWSGTMRWARNRIAIGGETQNDQIDVLRNINGAENCRVLFNDTSEAGVVAAVRRAERLARLAQETPRSDLLARFQNEVVPPPVPTFFSEATYQIDAEHQAATARLLTQRAEGAGLLSAGDVDVRARVMAIFDTLGHPVRSVKYTWAKMSVSVRDPQGTTSGWAGTEWSDWSQIDGEQLSAIALDKCLRGRNAVKIEPGRYTTILEPQAVCDLVSMMMYPDLGLIGQLGNWGVNPDRPFVLRSEHPHPWRALREQRVVDPRITISTDPHDPNLVAPTFNPWGAMWEGTGWAQTGYAYRPETYGRVTWIEDGVLKKLSMGRRGARQDLWQDTGIINSGSFQMSGGETSVAEMIATTERGLVVTRFDNVQILNIPSVLLRGYTRDGVWLVEHGKITHAVKNLAFTESVLFALNNVEQLGPPHRVLHERQHDIGFGEYIPAHLGDVPQPVYVPPLKVKDFSFTSLTDAI